MCINSGLLKPDTIGFLRALLVFMIYCLKHQLIFRVVSGHIISVLPMNSAMKINLDLADSQQTVNISSQILQSPNIEPSSSIDLSNELKNK